MKRILIILLFLLTLNVNADTNVVTFNKCVDGDTAWFNYDGEKTKFRFLGIDTPESVHPNKKVQPFGKEASLYTCNLLENANNIVVEFDDGSSKQDKYDRYLAWVWVDGKLLQQELIEQGYAKVSYIYGDYKYTKSLCKIQKSAIDDKIGIWSLKKSEEGYCSTIFYSDASDNIVLLNNDVQQEDVFIQNVFKKYPYLFFIFAGLVLLFTKKKKLI